MTAKPVLPADPDYARLWQIVNKNNANRYQNYQKRTSRPIPVVVAEIAGQIEPERFVLVHGHIDSWHVGIGDNATGDATMLEIARVLRPGGRLVLGYRIDGEAAREFPASFYRFRDDEEVAETPESAGLACGDPLHRTFGRTCVSFRVAHR